MPTRDNEWVVSPSPPFLAIQEPTSTILCGDMNSSTVESQIVGESNVYTIPTPQRWRDEPDGPITKQPKLSRIKLSQTEFPDVQTTRRIVIPMNPHVACTGSYRGYWQVKWWSRCLCFRDPLTILLHVVQVTEYLRPILTCGAEVISYCYGTVHGNCIVESTAVPYQILSSLTVRCHSR
jgi:hypothetical protein